jgi:hypothetical protein
LGVDLLPGGFKRTQYGRIIIPFSLLRNMEYVLEDSKGEVQEEAKAR